jgi:hypothetical protein
MTLSTVGYLYSVPLQERGPSYYVNLGELEWEQKHALKQLAVVAGVEDLSVVHGALGVLATFPPAALDILTALPDQLLRDAGVLYSGMAPPRLMHGALTGSLDRALLRRIQVEQGRTRCTRGANTANIKCLQ